MESSELNVTILTLKLCSYIFQERLLKMDCCCGDPSCGYCQAARAPNSNNFYQFDDFIPMDPYGGHLKTIPEGDENKEDAEYDNDEDEENIDEDIHDIEFTGQSDKHFLGVEGINTSTGSTGSEDSDDEGLKEKSEQLLQLENLFKQSLLRFNQTALPSSPTEDKLDLVSEDEKKRLRNTEAARRCREKIKRKTEDLEGELTSLTARNDLLNQHRIRLLSQVEEQMRMLDMMKKRNPELGHTISFEAKKIVDTYTEQVEKKRQAIQEYFDKTCTKTY
ncbi:unnamed protein product [Caenorhabditis brenneri]